MNIAELANTMNQSEADVSAFVNCLRVWTNKGLSIEEAIKRHMQQMTHLVNNACNLPKEIVVEAFYG